MGTFSIEKDFLLDGRPFRIISGAMHYFRIPPAYWRDRLEKLRAMGCNTVETYTPWNLHEPQEREYNFSGGLDVAAFLKTAQEVGLYAIVRPSPFICAEWEFGGLPAWLLKGEDIPLRSSQGPFLSYVERYYRRLFQEIAPLQIDKGGPILLVQVENEFGAWGKKDPAYLRALARLMRENGATVPFITSDNLENDSLSRGTTPEALATVNFGSKAPERLEILRPYTKGGPLMVTEFWVGWFDAWGGSAHHTADPAGNARDLDEILQRGSVNIYMFHGGTNFGFMNGANYYDRLTPDVTSYDYDAPLTEDGQITPKYKAFQEVIARHAPLPQVEFSTSIQRVCFGPVAWDGTANLFDVLSRLSAPKRLEGPQSMERLGQGYGYILYHTTLPAGTHAASLELTKAADRAQVFLNGAPALTLYDRELLEAHPVDWHLEEDTALDILVENMGRVNYGPNMARQRKGIDGAVLLDGEPVRDWEAFPLPLKGPELCGIPFLEDKPVKGPAFYHFTLYAEETGDTFLDMEGWGKGCVFINGVNLGRYWSLGPQRRLYIPGPLLRMGENELIILETEGTVKDSVSLEAEPKLG